MAYIYLYKLLFYIGNRVSGHSVYLIRTFRRISYMQLLSINDQELTLNNLIPKYNVKVNTYLSVVGTFV